MSQHLDKNVEKHLFFGIKMKRVRWRGRRGRGRSRACLCCSRVPEGGFAETTCHAECGSRRSEGAVCSRVCEGYGRRGAEAGLARAGAGRRRVSVNRGVKYGE